jgi:hypothetical protein
MRTAYVNSYKETQNNDKSVEAEELAGGSELGFTTLTG